MRSYPVTVAIAVFAVLIGGCQRSDIAQAWAITTGPARPVAVTPKREVPPEARALSNAFAAAARAIRPSVVRLDVEMSQPRQPSPDADIEEFLRRFFGVDEIPFQSRQVQRGTGSGVIFNPAGHILTTSHVVRGASKVTIRLVDHRSFQGKVVGTDPFTDIGVVKFVELPPGLVAARLGNSDELQVGEWSIAVGSPLGMEQTVTAGIIGGVGRTGTGFPLEPAAQVRKYIQTDAKINPGNSGGPLVNLEGEVIGVNTVINVGPGGSYGFAIPINQAAEVARTLVREGRVRYPHVGISAVDVADAPEDVRKQLGTKLPEKGALVVALMPGGPAARAGLRRGDVITKVGGQEVETAGDVVGAISEQRIGGTVSIGYLRSGQDRTVQVDVAALSGERPPNTGRDDDRIGVALDTLTESVARALDLDPKTKGAVVTEVEPGSLAERAGIVPGDVIREVDRRPVVSAAEAAAALRTNARGDAHLLRITRASGTSFVTVVPNTGRGSD
jgi:serine protease Do